MFRSVSLLLIIGTACAVQLEYLKIHYAEGSVEETEDLLMPEPELLPGACWSCKWAINKVKKQLSSNDNVDVIKTKLRSVCGQIGFLKALCRKVIDKYFDVLVEELSTTDDPETICANINICKSMAMKQLIKNCP